MATRWGVVGTGKISHDFCVAVGSEPTEEHQLVAVAARNLEDAKKFADIHKISKTYGSYEELARDEDVEVVYIGTVNATHLPIAQLMMEKDKHLLMEKPLAINSDQVDEMLRIANSKKLFLMEAVWSRFLPSYQFLKEQLEGGVIGQVKHVFSTFGMANYLDESSKKSQGRGILFSLGFYCLNLSQLVYGDIQPEKVLALGNLNGDGVDLDVTVTMMYKEGQMASFSASGQANFPNEAVIVGTRGTIRIPAPFWCSDTILINDSEHKFPFPPIKIYGNFPNPSGLRYEAREVRRCLKNGRLQSETISHAFSRKFHKILEEIKKQIGVLNQQD